MEEYRNRFLKIIIIIKERRKKYKLRKGTEREEEKRDKKSERDNVRKSRRGEEWRSKEERNKERSGETEGDKEKMKDNVTICEKKIRKRRWRSKG